MSVDTTARAIFISYRRADAEGETGHLYEDLTRVFGDDSVFMDVAGIKPGADFRKVIETNIDACGILLAVVGPQWATVTDTTGARRLDNPKDSVRIEIAAAIARGVTIIPVMVRGAHMPHPDVLPDDLSQFSFFNSFEINHARWNSDVALLIDALHSYLPAKPPTPPLPPAPPPAPTPAPPAPDRRYPPPAATLPSRPASPKKVLGLAVGVLIAIGAGILLLAGIIYAAIDYSEQNPQAASPYGQPLPPAVASMIGAWSNPTTMNAEDALTGVRITQPSAGLIEVEAFGQCPNRICNWGIQPATFNQTNAVTNIYHLGNTAAEIQQQRLAVITLSAGPMGLNVYLQNTWNDPSSGQTLHNNRSYLFTRIPNQ